MAIGPWAWPEASSEPCPWAVLGLQECDHSQTDSLEDEEIETFYRMLTQRAEIDRAFAEAAGSAETLSVEKLVTFLQHQQREEEAGPALALSLIERYEPSETGEGPTVTEPMAGRLMEQQTDRQTVVLQGAIPRVADQCVAILCKQADRRKRSVSTLSGPHLPPVPSSMGIEHSCPET